MIRGQRHPIEISLPIQAKLHNRFDFEVVDSVTGEVKQTAYAENIILNSWWTKVFTPAMANTYIHVGTGTGTLAPTRTSLFTFLAGKSSVWSSSESNEEENWVSAKRVATFLESEYPNTVWTEVGIGSSSTSATLTTHALIKDLNGNPVALTKGDADIINVYSTVYVYLPRTEGIRIPLPKGVPALHSNGSMFGWLLGMQSSFPASYHYVLKGDLLGTNNGYHFNNFPSDPESEYTSSYNQDGDSGTTRVGSAATKTLTMTLKRLAADAFNSSFGVRSIAFASGNGYERYLMQVDLQASVPAPWFPHSTIVGETVATGDGSTLAFNTKFPFLKNDGSFVLKKNGAAVDPADYVVSYGDPNGGDLIYHVKVLDYSHTNFMIGVAQTYNPLSAYVIFENPWYEKFGIDNFGNGPQVEAWTSDSPTGPWTSLGLLTSGTLAIPAEHKNKRYWKVNPASTSSRPDFVIINSSALAANKNINFVAGKAPEIGDVITVDYHCEVIAKTADNVFDLKIDIVLQEKIV